MSSPTYTKSAATSWPSNTPEATKMAVEKFFQFLDGYSPEAAKEWSQLYRVDGEFQAFGKVFKGHEAIRQHILRFWSSFPGLNHVPKKVYSHGDDMMDLTILTSYEITFANGQFVSGESVALLKFVEKDGRLVLTTNRLILDPNPLMSGLASVSEMKIQSTDEQQANKPSVIHTENAHLVG
ncbi:hypothetical protein N7523_000119 [Penicillium sp. IBT 18751x]|nr:hypothetical protein N7523_000119 [Penicillium sp. IBT 18751x]